MIGRAGTHELDSGRVEGDDPLAPFGPNAALHVARTDGFPHCADIMVNSTYWDDSGEVAAFEELVGSHGGMGGAQCYPFALAPVEFALPERADRRSSSDASPDAALAGRSRSPLLRDRRAARGRRLACLTLTAPGSLSVTWVGHSTVRLELDGTTLLTDPLLGRRAGPLVRIAAPPPAGVAEGLDAVLLSHLHADHADLPSLRMLPAGTPIIAPAGSGGWLHARGFGDVHELRPHESLDVGAVRVVATPAVHEGRRAPFGPRSESIGFIGRGVARRVLRG